MIPTEVIETISAGEMLTRLRKLGIRMNYDTFIKLVERGAFPFVYMVDGGKEDSEKRVFLILEKDFTAWVNSYAVVREGTTT